MAFQLPKGGGRQLGHMAAMRSNRGDINIWKPDSVEVINHIEARAGRADSRSVWVEVLLGGLTLRVRVDASSLAHDLSEAERWRRSG